MTPEKKLEIWFVKTCEERGWLCWKIVSPGRRGVPDRLVLANSAAYFVELKASNGRLSPLQKDTIGNLESRGQRVFVVWDKEQAEKVLQLIASA